jgi:uncharacterized tellurite resistance protein B-like protein
MLNKLMNQFAPTAPESESSPGERLKMATCVVLLEAARADDEFTDDERANIVATLQQRFDLSESDVTELITAATAERKQSSDLWKFTHQINEACTTEEKIGIVEEIWRVIVADGGIHGQENTLAHQIARLLNLTHSQLIEAKVKVLEEYRNG